MLEINNYLYQLNILNIFNEKMAWVETVSIPF